MHGIDSLWGDIMEKRMTLSLSEETYETLVKLANKGNTSVVGIIREGIALRQFVQEKIEQGKEIAVVTQDDEIEEKLVVGRNHVAA